MPKSKSSTSKTGYASPVTPPATSTYKDRNLAGMTPAKATDLIPTPAAPIPLHKRMAGGG